MKFDPNQLIDNRYQIIEKIGQGGMGSVWKAIDQQLDDEVVIKMPLVNSEPALLQRFATEARTMRKHSIGNPNIIDIHGVGTVDGTPYYVMRFLPGGSLEDRCPLVDSAEASEFKIETFEWLLSIGKALDYLQGNGVLHRDVKPANILFNQSGDAYLTDFGIAKNPTDVTNFTQHVTATGTSPGTFGYMAPEVLNPEPNMPIGGAVDQYALAVTLHEAIAGKRPYDSTNVVKLYLQTQAGCPPLRDSFPHLPVVASDAVARALSSDPAKRFGSCRSFADTFLNGLRNSSEAPTGMVHVGDSSEQGGGIRGGKSVAPPKNNSPSAGGSLFAEANKKSVHAQKTTASTSSRVPWVTVGVAIPLLIFLGGGLALSGAFSGNDQPRNVSPGSSNATTLAPDSAVGTPTDQSRPALLAKLESENITELDATQYKEGPLSLVEKHAKLGFDEAEAELKLRAERLEKLNSVIGSKARPLKYERWIELDGKFDPIQTFEKDQVYVVEFWATWCEPCMPALLKTRDLQIAYGDKAKFINVSDGPEKRIKDVLERLDEKDDSGARSLQSVLRFATTGEGEFEDWINQLFDQKDLIQMIPTAVIVGRSGQIAWIGHPRDIDVPLAKVVEGSWTRNIFAADYEVSLLHQKLGYSALDDASVVLSKLKSLKEIAPNDKDLSEKVLALEARVAVQTSSPRAVGQISKLTTQQPKHETNIRLVRNWAYHLSTLESPPAPSIVDASVKFSRMMVRQVDDGRADNSKLIEALNVHASLLFGSKKYLEAFAVQSRSAALSKNGEKLEKLAQRVYTMISNAKKDAGSEVSTELRQAALAATRRASELGDAEAQYSLGEMYSNGHGVSKDNKEAAQWFGKSAEQNYGPAQMSLATHYLNGLGVEQDLGEAQKLLQRAQASGVNGAAKLLAEVNQRIKSSAAPAPKEALGSGLSHSDALSKISAYLRRKNLALGDLKSRFPEYGAIINSLSRNEKFRTQGVTLPFPSTATWNSRPEIRDKIISVLTQHGVLN